MAHTTTVNGEFSSQALGSEGQAPTSPTASVPSRHKRAARSCLLCHQRKIRCDKRSPCSNCVRADVMCCYPASEPPGRRPPKSTIAEVAARVARLERTITAISNDSYRVDFNDTSTSAVKSPASEADTNKTQTVGDNSEELLVQDGYSTRYINDVLLSRVLEEVSSPLP